MGRNAIFEQPMTGAERQARSRAMQRTRLLESHPQIIASRVAGILCELDHVNPVAADKALRLVAADIAKRRRARAGELKGHRAEQARKRRNLQS
jgi:hypothetical protein